MTTHPTPSGRQLSGKAGGEKTKARHGSEFFREIVRRGGLARGKQVPPTMIAMTQGEHEKHHRGEPIETPLFDHSNPTTKSLRPLP